MKAGFILLLIALIQFSSQTKFENSNYCISNDIEQIDSCLINKTLKEAITQLNIDTSQFIPYRHEHRNLEGIYIRLLDTCHITIIIAKEYQLSERQLTENFQQTYKYILNSKISGICWRKNKKGKVRVVGNMRWLDCWDT